MTLRRNNIYNPLPNSILSSSYLNIQPNVSTIDTLKNFVSQLKIGNSQGLAYNADGIDADKKQIKTIEKYNTTMEPIAYENEKFIQEEKYSTSLFGKIENFFNDTFKDTKNLLGFNVDYKAFLFAIFILIIIIKI